MTSGLTLIGSIIMLRILLFIIIIIIIIIIIFKNRMFENLIAFSV